MCMMPFIGHKQEVYQLVLGKGCVKKIMKEFMRKYFPPYLFFPVLMLIVSNIGVYYGAKVFNAILGRPYIDMTGALELATPVIPMFSLFYVAAFPFWYISYYLLCRSSKELCYQIVLTDVIAKLFCGALFVLIPTTNIRPEVTGAGIGEIVLRFIYHMDTPHNLFPSVHCLESWLCFAYIRDSKAPRWLKISCFLLAIAICLSTVFVAQHVWIDVFAGVLIAEFFRVFVPYIMSVMSTAKIQPHRVRY